MYLSLEIRRTGIGFDDAEVTKRTHARLVRDALRSSAEHHVAFHLPKHFEDNPSTRPGGPYGFKRRGSKYLQRKQRLVGHQIPNVLTGRMRISVIGGVKITATQNRVRIYLRNYFAMTPERWAEVTAITPGEFRKLRQVAAASYRDAAALPENRRQRRIKVTA